MAKTKTKIQTKDKTMTWISLEEEFVGRKSQKGWDFKQVKREGMIALYMKTDGDHIYYEVIVIQKHNGRTFPGGVKVLPSFFYPSDTMWGLYGWCYSQNCLDKAEEKYNELIKSQSAKKV